MRGLRPRIVYVRTVDVAFCSATNTRDVLLRRVHQWGLPMDDTLLPIIWIGLVAFFSAIFGALARTKPAVDLTLQIANKKMTFDELLSHHRRPNLDVALLSLIQQKRVGWRFNDQHRPQHSGKPPPFSLSQCTFWRTRGSGGIRTSPFAARIDSA